MWQYFILGNDDIGNVEEPRQKLEDMFFGMKDIDSDDIEDQALADTINNIGVMVLRSNEEFPPKNYSKLPIEIKVLTSYEKVKLIY